MTHNNGSRRAAIITLARWQGSGRPLARLLEETLDSAGLRDVRDHGLATAITIGVVRNLRLLDWAIDHFSSRPLGKLKMEVLQGLRVGACQILTMDRIPVSAAVNETVAALKSLGEPKWVTGFVNGVLRSIARTRDTAPAWPVSENLPEVVRLNLPDWLWKRWVERHCQAAARFLALAGNTPPPLTLRARTGCKSREELLTRLAVAGIPAEVGRYAPDAVILPDWQGPVALLPGFSEGLFQVQDEAAQLAVFLLSPFAAGGYLDACSGLGGKTTHLAELAPANSRILAIEPDTRRFRLLGENLARLNLSALVECSQLRIEDLTENGATFARILLDAPCSGLGVIRRHPDIPWNRQPGDFSLYQEGQLNLLRAAAKLLAPGGILVYAVCTFEPEETTEVLTTFLSSHPEFAITNASEYLPEAARELVDEHGFFATQHKLGGLDGFFAARLVRN